jgi:hypothetical protein
MAVSSRKEELERRLAQARRLLKDVFDPVTKERLERLTDDLEDNKSKNRTKKYGRVAMNCAKPPC